MVLWMMAACTLVGGGEAGTQVLTTEVVDCGIEIDSVFPADGTTDVFISPYYDRPRVVGPDDVTYAIVDADGEPSFLYPEFEASDGGWEPSLGLGSAGPRNATLRIQGTDADGCAQTLSTFTTGPWGSFESSLYDGRAVALQFPPGDPALLGSVLGGDLPSGFLFGPTGETEGWGAIPVESGELDTCLSTPIVSNARPVNGVLVITNLNGVFSGVAEDFNFAWEGLSIDALVNVETGDWARVNVEGTLRAPSGVCFSNCPPCPDDPEQVCIDVTATDLTATAVPYAWEAVDVPDPQACFEAEAP